MAEEKLGIKLEKMEICRSHRVGRKNAPPTDNKLSRPRPIIVFFVSYNMRRRIYSNERSLKGTNVTIREDLTVQNRNALKVAMDKYGARNTWTIDGRIHYVGQDGRKHRYDPVEEEELLYFEQTD